eukprot:TRINITY_DN458_c0_g1_i1.p1 TRINITY_DN458_c0_g1~~TRINITY_DN458_c0_g1_i1.p1  ORF type:complete len:130 (-),score=13.55 TRINITY_DN458_c0_g1_i1:771-1160(-)
MPWARSYGFESTSNIYVCYNKHSASISQYVTTELQTLSTIEAAKIKELLERLRTRKCRECSLSIGAQELGLAAFHTVPVGDAVSFNQGLSVIITGTKDDTTSFVLHLDPTMPVVRGECAMDRSYGSCSC